MIQTQPSEMVSEVLRTLNSRLNLDQSGPVKYF